MWQKTTHECKNEFLCILVGPTWLKTHISNITSFVIITFITIIIIITIIIYILLT